MCVKTIQPLNHLKIFPLETIYQVSGVNKYFRSQPFDRQGVLLVGLVGSTLFELLKTNLMTCRP